MKLRAGFAFVANLSAVRGPAKMHLAKGHQLRRATAKEIETIRRSLQELSPSPRFLFTDLWERRLFQRDRIQEGLPESEWRYFVIAFRGSNHTIASIREASEIAPVELEILFTVVNGGLVWHQDHLFQALQEAQHNDDFFVEISAGDVSDIKRLRTQLEGNVSHVLNLRPFLNQLAGLKGFPRRSPLRFLGYFAILESLLTHSPQPTDPYDSITRQVKKKLILLDHRWPRKIDYTPFGGASTEKIWGGMYAYRSDVAHGNMPDFKKKFSILKNHALALGLLKETTKAIIRYGLDEPQLLVDLREC